jgi:uncharacterized protein (TIGR02246 family)
MKKAIVVAPVLTAVLALAGWQNAAYAAEKRAKGAGGGVEATIMKLYDKIMVASLKGDVATFKELYAEDYVSVSVISGAPSAKADLIESFKSGKLKYDSLVPSDVKVHVYGPTTAVVTATAEIKGKLGEQDIGGSYRTSRLFLKRGGKWRVVFFQTTKVPT